MCVLFNFVLEHIYAEPTNRIGGRSALKNTDGASYSVRAAVAFIGVSRILQLKGFTASGGSGIFRKGSSRRVPSLGPGAKPR